MFFNFTSLIQLAATFNFAFVAASTTKFFRELMQNDVFKVNAKFDESFGVYESKINTDIMSLSQMETIASSLPMSIVSLQA